MNKIEENTKSSFFLGGRLGTLLDRWQPPSGMVLIGTALFVGICTGIGAVLFRYLIQGVAWVGYQWIPDVTPGSGKAYVIIVPAIGGLLVGLLVYNFAREAKGHGVPEVMEAVALRGGRIRPRVALVKSLASSLTIGSGGSAGREGPIVQIGSAIGSTVGQALNLSDSRISNLVACGAAAGIAATFNAPIAGVIFALEVILGRFSVRNFSTVVIAAVAASVVGRAALGDVPAFSIPVDYGVNSLWEFLFYPVLGILAAIVGVVFTRSLYWSEDLFDAFKRIPEWVKPAVGGALLGVLAFTYPLLSLTQPITWARIPHVFNVGYDIIESALANELVLSAALVLLIAKIVATCLTLGSGGSGGVFAPSLFMGAMLGAAFELVVNRLFPGVSAPAGAYALVGMAAVFAASAHAPITAVIILFELTGDYHIILPLMLTVVVATLLSQLMLRGESIYTLKLSRRGVRLDRGRDMDILQGVTVGEVMTRDPEVVSMSTSIMDLDEIFVRSHHHGLMVVDEEGKLWGIVTLTDLDRALEEKRSKATTVAEIATCWPNLKVAYPDETMGDALARMGSRGLGRLPVVSREDTHQLLGLLRRKGISRAYSLGLTRREVIHQRANRLQTHYEKEAEFVEILLVADDVAIGKKVEEIGPSMPRDCILVSIQRDGHVVIPQGNTVFQTGDLVTAFVRKQKAKELIHSLRGPEKT
ncbi:MAG TPA: chloride channel protein [candidate division Zixibacteria bacterium]|nr:chloride channel protein [candidate division Zixibacteria bacterium]